VGFLQLVQPEPIEAKVQARARAVSLVASGAEVGTFNVFADKKRKYKPSLVLQRSFPQGLEQSTPVILNKEIKEKSYLIGLIPKPFVMIFPSI